MGLFTRKTKEEKQAEIEQYIEEGKKAMLDGTFRVEFVEYPDQDSYTNSTGTKILATAAFGLIGAAATAGSKKRDRQEYKPTIKLAEKGLVINKHHRIPWEDITDVGCEGTFAKINMGEYRIDFIFKTNSKKNAPLAKFFRDTIKERIPSDEGW